jgi:hypothetical protein
MMIEPNNDTLAEMLEGTRDALEKALAKTARLEVEKADLAEKVLIYAHRAAPKRDEQLRIQAVGAAISGRDWHAAERAYEAIRDEFDRRETQSPQPNGLLAQIKQTALTAGAPGELPVPKALAHIIRLCIDGDRENQNDLG